MKKIEKIESTAVYQKHPYGGEPILIIGKQLSLEEVALKLNEIIDYLNQNHNKKR